MTLSRRFLMPSTRSIFTMRPARPPLPALAGWIVFTFLFAAIGAYASAEAGSFYLQLRRPDWAPPPWLFGPAWTALYLLMSIAVWRVAGVRGWRAAGGALVLYCVQLVANALWTWLFFVWHRGLLASGDIVVLLLLIGATAVAFRRHDRLAAVLLLPYLAWVAFACALSVTIWRMNPGVLH